MTKTRLESDMESSPALKPLSEPGNRQLFGLGFDFDGKRPPTPYGGEVFGIDIVVVSFRFRPTPTRKGAGDVEERFAIPGGPRGRGCLLDCQSVRQAAVVVDVIDEWHAGIGTDWQ